MPRSASAGGPRLFAAPTEGGWATAYLSADGILSANPHPVPVRPGSVSRRLGLALEWTSDTINRSELGDIPVRLTNTSATPWIADGDDHDYVHAWFLTDGRRHGPDQFSRAAHRGSLHDLAPGDSLVLAVDFGRTTPIPEPGHYAVQAVLTSLDLWTGQHDIHLI
jgi:hypothetical protein